MWSPTHHLRCKLGPDSWQLEQRDKLLPRHLLSFVGECFTLTTREPFQSDSLQLVGHSPLTLSVRSLLETGEAQLLFIMEVRLRGVSSVSIRAVPTNRMLMAFPWSGPCLRTSGIVSSPLNISFGQFLSSGDSRPRAISTAWLPSTSTWSSVYFRRLAVWCCLRQCLIMYSCLTWGLLCNPGWPQSLGPLAFASQLWDYRVCHLEFISWLTWPLL